MINKLIYLTLFVLITISASAQKKDRYSLRMKDCEQFPALLDSLHSLKWDNAKKEWLPDAIRHYYSSNGKYDRLIFLYGDTRKQYRSWEYYYDAQGNMDLAVSSYWGNDTWIINLKKESVFDEDNHKLNELRSSYLNGEWSFKAFYYFDYEGDRIVKSHYQLKDEFGELYDVVYTVNKFENDKLIESVSFNAEDESIREVNRFYYDEEGKLSEFIILIPDNQASSEEQLIPVRRRTYFYNEFSMLREVIFEEMGNLNWEVKSKYIYYYKLDSAKKITICHNNKEICINKNALPAHLRHGDKLGPCDEIEKSVKNKNLKKEHKDLPFTVYPNPASEKLTVRFNNPESDEFYRLEIADMYGKVVRNIELDGRPEITLNKGNLKGGSYYLKVSGREVYSFIIVFK